MKRVGSYINPNTGEEDWIEPDTIEKIMLTPKKVTKVGDTYETPISFTIIYKESEEKVGIYAQYLSDHKNYTSETIDFPLEDFCNEIVSVVYANKTLDNSNLVKEAKQKTTTSLVNRLLSENIIVSDFHLDGLGFVIVDEKKIMLFESVDFKYITDPTPQMSLVLNGCIGAVSLQNLKDPQIFFNTNNHQLNFKMESILTANEGRIKNYEIVISDITITPKTQLINLKSFGDEEDLIQNRLSLLDSFSNIKDDFDDRFNDIL